MPVPGTLPRDTLHFYRDLTPLSSFAEATEARTHKDVPEDWWIVIADVAGSTRAIEAGAYKKVNTVGVACIAAVANVDRSVDLPFIFGGDGATFAVPEALRERVECALRGAQHLARQSFGLTLRAGLVSVSELTLQSHWVRLAKVRLSPHVMQPALSGRGWDEAERWVKVPGAPGMRQVEEGNGPAEASFEGFECRWQGVPSFKDHKLSCWSQRPRTMRTKTSQPTSACWTVSRIFTGKSHSTIPCALATCGLPRVPNRCLTSGACAR